MNALRRRRSGISAVCAEGMASSSVQLAEHGRERHVEEFVAEFIGDVQDPASPILDARRHHRPAHETLRVLAGLAQVHGGTAIVGKGGGFRYGSKATFWLSADDFRSTPINGHRQIG